MSGHPPIPRDASRWRPSPPGSERDFFRFVDRRPSPTQFVYQAFTNFFSLPTDLFRPQQAVACNVGAVVGQDRHARPVFTIRSSAYLYTHP